MAMIEAQAQRPILPQEMKLLAQKEIPRQLTDLEKGVWPLALAEVVNQFSSQAYLGSSETEILILQRNEGVFPLSVNWKAPVGSDRLLEGLARRLDGRVENIVAGDWRRLLDSREAQALQMAKMRGDKEEMVAIRALGIERVKREEILLARFIRGVGGIRTSSRGFGEKPEKPRLPEGLEDAPGYAAACAAAGIGSLKSKDGEVVGAAVAVVTVAGLLSSCASPTIAEINTVEFRPTINFFVSAQPAEEIASARLLEENHYGSEPNVVTCDPCGGSTKTPTPTATRTRTPYRTSTSKSTETRPAPTATRPPRPTETRESTRVRTNTAPAPSATLKPTEVLPSPTATSIFEQISRSGAYLVSAEESSSAGGENLNPQNLREKNKAKITTLAGKINSAVIRGDLPKATKGNQVIFTFEGVSTDGVAKQVGAIVARDGRAWKVSPEGKVNIWAREGASLCTGCSLFVEGGEGGREFIKQGATALWEVKAFDATGDVCRLREVDVNGQPKPGGREEVALLVSVSPVSGMTEFLKISGVKFLETPAGMVPKVDAFFDPVAGVFEFRNEKNVVVAVWSPFNGWELGGPNQVFAPEPTPTPEASVLQLDGFKTTWNNQEERWDYIDVDGQAIAYWDEKGNNGNGKIELREGVTELDFEKHRGIFEDWTAEESFANLKPGEIPIVVETRQGQVVTRKSLHEFLGFRNIPKDSKVIAPFGGSSSAGGVGGKRSVFIKNSTIKESLRIVGGNSQALSLLVELGDEIALINEGDLSDLGFSDQLHVMLGDANFDKGYDVGIKKIQRTDEGKLVRLKALKPL